MCTCLGTKPQHWAVLSGVVFLYLIGYLIQWTYDATSTANEMVHSHIKTVRSLNHKESTIINSQRYNVEEEPLGVVRRGKTDSRSTTSIYPTVFKNHPVHLANDTNRAHRDNIRLKSTQSGQICSKRRHFPSNTARWKSLSSGLEKYRQFHKHQLSTFNTGSRQSQSSMHTLIWSCTDVAKCSGLADQLYRIQFALILAMIFNRVLLIYWSTENDTYKTFQYLEPNKIDWSLRIEGIPNVQERLEMFQFADQLNSSTQHVMIGDDIPVPFYRSFTRARHIPQINSGFEKLGLTHILTPSEHHHNLAPVMGELLQYLFKFSQELVLKVDRIQASLGLVSHQYVAVHIRTGFSGNDKFEETGKFSQYKIIKDPDTWRSMLNCSVKLSRERISSRNAIFLATDSNTVKILAKDYKQIKTTNSTAFHTAHCTDECGLGVWIDFILMARARFLIRGGSGFSKIAGAFCSIPLKSQCNPNCNCNKS